jgi:hypothetical protein
MGAIKKIPACFSLYDGLITHFTNNGIAIEIITEIIAFIAYFAIAYFPTPVANIFFFHIGLQ